MYHSPVMLKECIEGLAISASGFYVDVTFGGGGHTRAILETLTEGKVIAFDQDEDARQNLPDDERIIFVNQNFRHLKRYLKLYHIDKVDGLLADLGVSSYQIDKPEKGFSTRFEGQLDMRMDTRKSLTAEEVINNYEEEQLATLFYLYGELNQSRKIAKAIVSKRAEQRIATTSELADIIRKYAPRNMENKVLAQAFQAIRIEVNDELGSLKEMLLQCSEVIRPGGKLVVMSYHSLEDRLVKNFIKTGNFEGEPKKDFYGNLIAPFEQVNRKIILASDEEIERNPRARSAKLRIAERREE